MYALLCNYASDKDHCWPSQKTLATRLACSVSSIKNYLAELVRERLIEVRHENYRSSVYYILQPEALRKGAAPAGDQPKSDSGQPESGHINNLSKQQEEKNTPLPPMKPERKDALSSSAPSAGGVGSAELDFETAWESYPERKPRALPGWHGSNFCAAGSFRRCRSCCQPLPAPAHRRAGRRNRAALSRKWLTGCADSAGWTRLCPCHHAFPRLIPVYGNSCGRKKSRNNWSCRGNAGRKKDSALCSRPLPRNSMLPTMKQWLSASGCTCIRCVVRHRLRMSLRQQAGTSWPFCGRERGKLRKSAI